MRFAAIADVHGNRFALEAVLADIATNGISEVVNLGDHLSGPLEAARTADILMERGFPSVLGDQDRRLVELRTDGASSRSDFRQLKRKHLDWMAVCHRPLFIGMKSFFAMERRKMMRAFGSITWPPMALCAKAPSRQ
jgi:predicted phosphodiesterase